MYVLIAVPKACSNKQVAKVTEHENLAVIVAAKSKLEEAHSKYIKESTALQKTNPISFDEYEGTKEEYELYCLKFHTNYIRIGDDRYESRD